MSDDNQKIKNNKNNFGYNFFNLDSGKSDADQN